MPARGNGSWRPVQQRATSRRTARPAFATRARPNRKWPLLAASCSRSRRVTAAGHRIRISTRTRMPPASPCNRCAKPGAQAVGRAVPPWRRISVAHAVSRRLLVRGQSRSKTSAVLRKRVPLRARPVDFGDSHVLCRDGSRAGRDAEGSINMRGARENRTRQRLIAAGLSGRHPVGHSGSWPSHRLPYAARLRAPSVRQKER